MHTHYIVRKLKHQNVCIGGLKSVEDKDNLELGTSFSSINTHLQKCKAKDLGRFMEENGLRKKVSHILSLFSQFA